MTTVKSISIHDVIKTINGKAEKKREVYDKILDKCFRKIEQTVKLNHLFCLFEVPEFILGFPLYSLNDCISYVLEKLRDNGFHVQYLFPKFIYISWNVPNNKLQSNTTPQQLLTNPRIAPSPGSKSNRLSFTAKKQAINKAIVTVTTVHNPSAVPILRIVPPKLPVSTISVSESEECPK